MKSRAQLLRSIEKFYSLAAKLSLGPVPSMPKDPNFTGLVEVPNQKFEAVDLPDVYPSVKDVTPKDLSSGVLPKPKSTTQTQPELIGKMTERLIQDVKDFILEMLEWIGNAKNPYKTDTAHYKKALSVSRSLEELLGDINAGTFLASDSLDPATTRKQIEHLDSFMNFYGKFQMLFSGTPKFRKLYYSLIILKNTMTNAMGSLPAADPSAYDMFAEQDAEEDLAESGTRNTVEETEKVLPEETQRVDLDKTQKVMG